MSDGGDEGQREPDTRERARLLREVARQFRAVDPAELTADQLWELCEAMPSAATRDEPSRPANVHSLPIKPEPDATLRRLRLTFAAAAADAERAADAIDRRLDGRR